MKAKEKIVRYVMLLASIVMLLSVVIPHHHHSNGMPCFKSLTTDTHSHKSASSHDCGCNGHNLVLFTSLLSHASDLDVSHLLFPLQVLFDYINPPERPFADILLTEAEPFILSPCTIRG